MKKIVSLSITGLFVFTLGAMAGEYTGHISDSKCGAAHADHSQKSIDCVTGCVKGGQTAVFVTEGGEVVKISNPDKVDAYLGHQVKVTGDIADGTLTIEAVENVAPVG